MAGPMYSKLRIDGYLGQKTCLALQIYMRTKQGVYRSPLLLDGAWGPQTVRGLQGWMQKRGYYRGYNVDGQYGPMTREHFGNMMNNSYPRAARGNRAAWPFRGDLRASPPREEVIQLQYFLNYYYMN